MNLNVRGKEDVERDVTRLQGVLQRLETGTATPNDFIHTVGVLCELCGTEELPEETLAFLDKVTNALSPLWWQVDRLVDPSLRRPVDLLVREIQFRCRSALEEYSFPRDSHGQGVLEGFSEAIATVLDTYYDQNRE